MDGGALAEVSTNVITGNLRTLEASSANDRLQPHSWALSPYCTAQFGEASMSSISYHVCLYPCIVHSEGTT